MSNHPNVLNDIPKEKLLSQNVKLDDTQKLQKEP